jgi:hypothetical protein
MYIKYKKSIKNTVKLIKITLTSNLFYIYILITRN